MGVLKSGTFRFIVQGYSIYVPYTFEVIQHNTLQLELGTPSDVDSDYDAELKVRPYCNDVGNQYFIVSANNSKSNNYVSGTTTFTWAFNGDYDVRIEADGYDAADNSVNVSVEIYDGSNYANDYMTGKATLKFADGTYYNSAPYVSLYVSNVGAGKTASLEWSFSDYDGDSVETVSLTRYYQAAGSTSWQKTALSVSGSSTSYSDAVPESYAGGKVYWEVYARDSYGEGTYKSSDIYTLNAAPTTPGTPILPLTIKSGEAITVSWDASQDADGNLAGYKLERSVDGGNWAEIYQGSSASAVCTVPEGAAAIAFRVKAYDSQGLESAYAVSSTAAVTSAAAVIAGSVTVDGVSKQLSGEGYANIGGVWKELVGAYVYIDGTWKPLNGEAKQKSDEHTLLLIHGTEIADASIYNRELANAGVQISTAAGSLNSHVMHFNGAGKINLPIGDYFNFGEGDFTVEWREYVPSAFAVPGNPFTFDKDPPHFLWYYSGSNINLYFTTTYTGALITTIKTGRWVHRAFVRSGSMLYAFEDGTIVWSGSISGSAPYSAGYQMCVGGRSDVDQYFVGYMEEFRVSDIARWTSNFVPDSEPYES